ncbi:formylglycine-generating enzyme family protein [Candidatus Hydrogenedentota bacterium]
MRCVQLIALVGCAILASACNSETLKDDVDEGEIVTNSIRMKFRKIEPGTFMMGSDSGQDSEKPAHKVTLTRPFHIGVYEVTQAQYEQIMGTNPSHSKGPEQPVENVSWNDAQTFCRKLSEKENIKYRLPTEAEWEYACRAGTDTTFYWGELFNPEHAWSNFVFPGDERLEAARQVGRRKPNPWGLYDMIGNVSELCEDRFGDYEGGEQTDPRGYVRGSTRVTRGGSWYDRPLNSHSTSRRAADPESFSYRIGLRLVMETVAASAVVLSATEGRAVEASVGQVAPTSPEPLSLVAVEEGKTTTNSIGMKLRLIEPGSFIMGTDKAGFDEEPVHKVSLTKAFYMGVHEVTQVQYEEIMGRNPAKYKGPDNPVELVSWNEAQEFCLKLSEKENAQYRLPTEAEWEYACRAGTTTPYFWGYDFDDRYAWGRSYVTHAVGTKLPNAWGLFDMSGNVQEWCEDWYRDSYDSEEQVDPQGPSGGMARVLRGGSWSVESGGLSSTKRSRSLPTVPQKLCGFRVLRVERPGKTLSVSQEESVAADDIPPITNSIGMKLKLVQSGSFTMGSEKGPSHERPAHNVAITKPFYIGVYEVTQAQYEKVVGTNPSHFKGAGHPVEKVSWNDAREFCRKLSEEEKTVYRLPTEAEWEYACRAGAGTGYHWGDGFDARYAWNVDNSRGRTREVGKRRPNSWGLYDMSGNVFEWCADWYGGEYYAGSPEKDPQGPGGGTYRVLRGGYWQSKPSDLRSANRSVGDPSQKYNCWGFRVVRAME